MNARAVVGIALSLLGISACGGAGSENAPPSTPSTVESPTGTDAKGTESSSGGSPAEPGPAPSAPSAEPEEAAPAELGAGDSRTTDSIATLVKARRKEARECYEKALKQTPGLKGDVVIHFTLKPSGEVKHAELNEERSTIRQAAVSSCVIDVIRTISFPKSSKGLETTVNYPFNFNP